MNQHIEKKPAHPPAHPIMQAAIAVGLGLFSMISGPVAAERVAEPEHQVTLREGAFEVRVYAPQIAAEVTVAASSRNPANDGFQALANYIFGGNAPKAKIAMTAPVTTQASKTGQKIAMTAPVTSTPTASGYQVRFIMPAEYTMDSLPKPNNPNVRLVPIAAKRFVVVKFSGFTGEGTITNQTAALRRFAQSKSLNVQGEPVLARYDPPWTLPMMRRNEIWLEVR